MMNGDPSGFYNAPVSRGFIVASAVFSVLFGIQRRSNKLGLSYQVFILFSSIISLLLEALAVVVLKVSPSNFRASGPFGLIYALFIPFFFDIPVSTHFRVLGIKFSDKSLAYLGGPQSILPGICGTLSVSLYRMNVFGIRKAKLSSTIPPTSSSRSMFLNFPSTTAQQRNYSSVPSMVEPSEEYTATLVSMGFNRDSARQVLVQARDDINAATNILLEAQSQ